MSSTHIKVLEEISDYIFKIFLSRNALKSKNKQTKQLKVVINKC